MARLDVPGTSIITSYDPSGGNDDFNHFVKKGPPGWVVLADLKGPGYVSRLWMTGATGATRLRFFVDGEAEPTWDTTWGEWFGGIDPMTAPLAAYENYCWYSYVPLPYRKRLVIMTEQDDSKPGGWPRIFYQVNYSTLPRGQLVESLPGEVTPDAAVALREVRDAWSRPEVLDPGGLEQVEERVEVAPGRETPLLSVDGPAVIRTLDLICEFPAKASATAKDRVLRDVVLRMTWDNAKTPSVAVPLGDFFGSFWRRMRYRSLFFGMRGDTFLCRFPMPFARHASIHLQNQGPTPVKVRAAARVERLDAWDEGLGYFHAAWTKTAAQDVGRPHDVLRTKGRGKFVGCLLSATSFDKSWWLLEGDESIRVDGEDPPGWLGTGLEDYFNGGWYYQDVLTRPLHGLPFRAPFRTVQYRLHFPDPVYYEKSIDMVFERGPNQASHGEMESVAFYYGDQPYAAASRLGGPAARRPPADPLRAGTFMTEIAGHERLRDYRGASDYIDAYLEQIKDFPFVPMLRLRQAAYVEELEGFEAARSAYERWSGEDVDATTRAQAKDLLWFHEDESHALLTLFCSLETRAYLDGVVIGEAGSRDKTVTKRVELTPGKHTLVLEAKSKARPQVEWVQAFLRTHHGDVVTSPTWEWAYGAAGTWAPEKAEQYDWRPVEGTGVKGPPEAPFVWVEPNAMIKAQSLATGLRPPDGWEKRGPVFLYRTTFTTPG